MPPLIKRKPPVPKSEKHKAMEKFLAPVSQKWYRCSKCKAEHGYLPQRCQKCKALAKFLVEIPKDECRACQGTGRSSRGKVCWPCEGKGRLSNA